MPQVVTLQCPSCGSALPVGEAWRRAPKSRGTWLLNDTGVKCASCGNRFAIVQLWYVGLHYLIVAAWSVCAGLLLARINARLKLDERGGRWAALLIALVLPAVIMSGFIPLRLLRVRALRPGESVEFPLDGNSESGI